MRLDEQVKLLSRRVGVLEAEAEIARRLAGFDQRGAERGAALPLHRDRGGQLHPHHALSGVQGVALGLLLLASRRRRAQRGYLGGGPGRRCHIRHLGAVAARLRLAPGERCPGQAGLEGK